MRMNKPGFAWSLAALLVLSGCASGPGSIYVPAGAARTPVTGVPATEPVSGREEGRQDETAPGGTGESAPVPAPGYREAGEHLSPAALSLVQEADRLLAQGRTAEAVVRLERAQRIAPRSPEVYFKLAEAYVRSDQLARAEQFALKGLSLAGNNSRLQRAGWLLLADIRRARGNVAGASQAEARAAAL